MMMMMMMMMMTMMMMMMMMMLPDIEADVPDVSEDSDISWTPLRKTLKAKKAGRKGGHCKKSRTEAENYTESSVREEIQGNNNF
jgi:hypothetical protein